MEINKLKLDLIKAISRCEDPELLQTLAEILHLDASLPRSSPENLNLENPPWDLPDQNETNDLQQSIDEIFNP